MSAEHHSLVPKKLLPRHGRAYDGGMLEPRVAVLEEVVRGIGMSLVRLESGLGDLRNRLDTSVAELRDKVDTSVAVLRDKMDSSMSELRVETATSISELRDKQERDFHILFGALIATALGLAALLARSFHWF